MYEELIKALRFCAEKSNGWNCPACPGFDGLCSTGKEIRATAADAIREQTAQITALQGELEEEKSRRYQAECNYVHCREQGLQQLSDLARVTAERDAAVKDIETILLELRGGSICPIYCGTVNCYMRGGDMCRPEWRGRTMEKQDGER